MTTLIKDTRTKMSNRMATIILTEATLTNMEHIPTITAAARMATRTVR